MNNKLTLLPVGTTIKYLRYQKPLLCNPFLQQGANPYSGLALRLLNNKKGFKQLR